MCAGRGKPVTLVCTDVEGSTELWEWDKAAMDEAQALHDRIMRSQLSNFCGYEVRTSITRLFARQNMKCGYHDCLERDTAATVLFVVLLALCRLAQGCCAQEWK